MTGAMEGETEGNLDGSMDGFAEGAAVTGNSVTDTGVAIDGEAERNIDGATDELEGPIEDSDVGPEEGALPKLIVGISWLKVDEEGAQPRLGLEQRFPLLTLPST